ncbi:MAG: nucleotidyl transferase AbiEii/AbiGii toxin family protein [Thermomicrobiales bacterium]
MSDDRYDLLPAFGDLAGWAAARQISLATARVRFAQWAILASFASARPLRDGMVFKGGNALDFVWNPNRSTVDLDFSVERRVIGHAGLRQAMDAALEAGQRQHGVIAKVQRWNIYPRNPEQAAFSAVQASIGYALPDQATVIRRLDAGLASAQVIPVDIAFDDPICATASRPLAPGVSITVATAEDIAAEKLRALLQLPIRNQSRPQDVLDLAVLIRTATLDVDAVGRFLLVKAGAREVPVSREAFADPSIRERASREYPRLADQTRRAFIPFDEAFAEVLAFVARLPIP